MALLSAAGVDTEQWAKTSSQSRAAATALHGNTLAQDMLLCAAALRI